MVYTILQLRKMAELNLTPDCYKRYLQLIEPGVEQILHEYFRGWQNMETSLMLAAMKHDGVFKTNMAVFNLEKGDHEKYAGEIDILKYKKIEKMSVFELIDYLYQEHVIDENTQRLFHTLRARRNTIHKYDGKWSEEDRIYFEWGGSIAHSIYLGLMEESIRPETTAYFKRSAENTAAQLLAIIEKGLSA